MADELKQRILNLSNRALVHKYRYRLNKSKEDFTPTDFDCLTEHLLTIEHDGHSYVNLKPRQDKFEQVAPWQPCDQEQPYQDFIASLLAPELEQPAQQPQHTDSVVNYLLNKLPEQTL
jgi:hypothetical protein